MTVVVIEDFAGFKKAFSEATYHALDRSAIIAQSNIKELLSKHGAAPLSGKSTPSAAGQPPGLVTGSLRRSIQIDNSSNKGLKPAVLVGTNLVYGAVHEFGSNTHPKRPFVAPGASMSTAAIAKANVAIFRQVVKKFKGVT